MIVVAVDAEGWPGDVWANLAERAVRAGVAASDYAALAHIPAEAEVSVRLSDDAAVQLLNRDYRGKDKPTNVLSFPMLDGGELGDLLSARHPRGSGDPSNGSQDIADALESRIRGNDETGDPEVLLGDIILAYETCAREAAEKGVGLADHATHLIVHGTLHLLGYDHQGDAAAAAMEAIERRVCAALGLHDPYDDEED